MRLAVVVGSSYERNGKLAALPSSELDGDLVARRLSEPDAGYDVVRFEAERGLAERIEQWLSTQPQPIERLLVYFSGYCVLSEERGPALLLDGPRLGTFSMARLKNLFLHFASSACLIVDAAAVVDAKQGLDAVVESIGGALTADAPSLAALVAVRNSERPDSFGGSAFTGLALMALDWLASSRPPAQAVDINWLFSALRAEEQLWRDIPAANLFGGQQGFVILDVQKPRVDASTFRQRPLPSFADLDGVSDLDDLLGLKPRHSTDEAPTEPGVSIFDDEDEVTPAFRSATHSERPTAVEPLPAFEVSERTVEPAASASPVEPAAPVAPLAPMPALPDSDRPGAEATVNDEPAMALAASRVASRAHAPEAQIYRRAHAAFEALGDSDGAWNAACVLEALGEADINEALQASQHELDGLLAARAALDESDWRTALYPPDVDGQLVALLAALGPAAVRVGIGFAKHTGRFAAVDAAALQDPEKSTAMLAKTLLWTSRLLALSTPALYVMPDAPMLQVAQTEAAGVVAGRALGSGFGLGELAFLWGRQLARVRDELRALAFFAAPAELAELLTAALALAGASAIEVRALDGDSKRLYAALRREVRGAALDALRQAAAALAPADIRARAERALRALTLLGVRSGLVACGDLATAAELIRRFPDPGPAGVEEQLAELYAFAISEEYGNLRAQLGVRVAG